MTTSRSNTLAIIGMVLGTLLLGAAGASAKEIKVPGDYSSLETAIREARSGDKIVVTSSRVFRDNIVVRNARRLTITTSSRSRAVTIEARRVDQPALSLSSCSDLVFENFVIQSGSYGVYATNCRDIVLRNIKVQSASVGVSALSSQSIALEDSQVTMNIGSGLVGSGYILEGTTVSRNLGWGMEIVGDETRIGELAAELSATRIVDNVLGGILVRYLLVTAKETTIQENLGWGVEVGDRGTFTMTRGKAESLIAANALGGVHLTDATATLLARIADNGGVGALAERAVMDLVECTVSGQPEANLVYRGSSGSVSRSQVTASAGAGIDLQDAASVTLSGTTLSENEGWGARVDATSHLEATGGTVITRNAPDGILVDGGTATVSGSQVSANDGHGVLARGQAQLSMDGSTIAENAVHGILLDASTLTLGQTEVMGNGQDGIRALAGSLATITNGSRLSSNRQDGLYLDGATASLTGSEVRANQADGVSGTNSSQATLADSTVSQNLAHGMVVVASRLDVRNSEIADNTRNGIWAHDESTISIAGGLSRAARNGENGILVERSTASIGDCEASGNELDGVSAASGSQVIVENSTVAENQGEGILAAGSTLRVANSTLRGNGANGIHVLAKSSLEVRGGKTLVTLNGGDGILVEDSKATVNDCEVVDNLRSR